MPVLPLLDLFSFHSYIGALNRALLL
jgi:hypothetical protein